MKFNLKKLLKNLKLNEESISVVLGALVIVIIGILTVNYFKDKNGTTLPEALNTSATQNKNGKSHTVTKNETLWSISEDVYGSGYNWTDIYKANNLKSESLEVGQVLTLPEVSAKTAATPSVVSKLDKVMENTTPTANKTYKVVKGDSLWNISVKTYGNGYKWAEIAKLNKLKNPNIIHTGNVLMMPK